jgi:hypothetical protein
MIFGRRHYYYRRRGGCSLTLLTLLLLGAAYVALNRAHIAPELADKGADLQQMAGNFGQRIVGNLENSLQNLLGGFWRGHPDDVIARPRLFDTNVPLLYLPPVNSNQAAAANKEFASPIPSSEAGAQTEEPPVPLEDEYAPPDEDPVTNHEE